MPKIDKDASEFRSLLSSIKHFAGDIEIPENNSSKDAIDSPKKTRKVELTVWSPVNTDVFLNDKHHLIMRIDRNSGFDYVHSTISVSQSFDLIFVARGFEKTIPFDIDSVGDQLEYKLNAILNKKEIFDSYSREEAIEQISYIEPTRYAFEQLHQKGTSKDIDLLIQVLRKLAKHRGENYNYLIAECVRTLGELAQKYERMDDISFVLDIYKSYEAKSTYGWMFESIVKVLLLRIFLADIKCLQAKKSMAHQ